MDQTDKKIIGSTMIMGMAVLVLLGLHILYHETLPRDASYECIEWTSGQTEISRYLVETYMNWRDEVFVNKIGDDLVFADASIRGNDIKLSWYKVNSTGKHLIKEISATEKECKKFAIVVKKQRMTVTKA